MNIKMFLTVTLLGVSLYLGGSSVIYAESAENVTETTIPESLMQEMRSSIFFLGAILGRTGECTVYWIFFSR